MKQLLDVNVPGNDRARKWAQHWFKCVLHKRWCWRRSEGGGVVVWLWFRTYAWLDSLFWILGAELRVLFAWSWGLVECWEGNVLLPSYVLLLRFWDALSSISLLEESKALSHPASTFVFSKTQDREKLQGSQREIYILLTVLKEV